MRVTVRLFARARDLAGADCLALELPDGCTVGGLRQHLAEIRPGLRALVERSAIALKNEFAENETPLPAGAELSTRLDGVLGTLYLLFNEGYKASQGPRPMREELVASTSFRRPPTSAVFPMPGSPATNTICR